MELSEPLLLLLLFGLGTLAFVISTISGGGGALIMVPVINFALGVSNTAPILNLGTFIGRPSRLVIFRKHIQWKVVQWYAPAAILGAWTGSWLFKEINLERLQLLVGVFLISTVFQFRFGKKSQSFPMKLPYFLPLGFLVSVFGTMIGAMGPVLNPFYLNLGLDKEDLIATKTANAFIMGLAQLGSYTFLGLLSGKLWLYGLVLGLGATLGNILGKRFLKGMSSVRFRQWMIGLMVISGVILLARQLGG
ncbi:sulfite exporter TauE/SafE family protein [Robertkochia flava]|uniref:sulfite exporter TauE/SafE family protein n=1 Tax=Robertkochia flava TaxID=3447986 RepID=UPI001CCFC2B8|nr:sulfite exporter TauE/SafE family protein [Robertkochia marina]